MESASFWGFIGIAVTFAVARVTYTPPPGHEWVALLLLSGSAIFSVFAFLVQFRPLIARFIPSLHRRIAPDMPVHEAADYIVNDSRERLRTTPVGVEAIPGTVWVGEQFNDALERLKQQVRLGVIKTWGQQQIAEPSSPTFEASLSEIPTTYWETADFNWEFCKHRSDEPQTIRLGGQGKAVAYKRLTFSRSQVVAGWPRKPIWRRVTLLRTKPARITARTRRL